MKQNFKISILRAGLALVLGTTLGSGFSSVQAKSPADPKKVLRYAFPVLLACSIKGSIPAILSSNNQLFGERKFGSSKRL